MTWSGDTENDGFNRLLLGADLTAREITVLRAYCRYLLQTGVPFSQAYMERALAANPAIAAGLVRLFEARLDPAAQPRRAAAAARGNPAEQIVAQIRASLDSVTSLDEDRILRAYLELVQATLRTNFYRRDAAGAPLPYLSFKLDPGAIRDLPLPRPKFEIFVYSPRVEGVHLRMGYVARGGIRWSDRREDFRTEVLGLMKAQNVKNTLIVPVGAKGGFVPKRLPGGGREEIQAEVIACYRTFIRGLLDLTDNIAGGRVVPPPQVVRRDGDDAYLVVAADKGTATFSDIANAISADYGFWLGDAFASGGSAGYDHKRLAITARGGWECVKRHFRELGIDIQKTAFTAIGIGDMSGDVFGNGMLLSRHIRLQAAFDHRHIFLDPNPDAAVSFAERQRLFDLPRSSWDDYDRARISKGGGVFARSAKSITLSPEARALLGLESATHTPIEIMRAILRMPVDLLWNGGIGTYVKASRESNAEVGDRANDGLRINGRELKAKVVGEGGNLGFTQRGRIEYALAGGRLNTDFIDNSAGVNTSDVEVNLKILLNPIVQAGRLTAGERNRLLASMSGEVCALVLRNNYLQSQAISTLELQARARMSEFQHLIRSLERSGELNRALEFLPTDDELAERREAGAGSPARSSRSCSPTARSGSTPISSTRTCRRTRTSPPSSSATSRRPVRRRFARAIARHRLRREIIATATTNSLINRMGPTFVTRAQEDAGAEPAQIARAYTAAREIFEMRTIWTQIEDLDNKRAGESAVHRGVRNQPAAAPCHLLAACPAARAQGGHRGRGIPRRRARARVAHRPGALRFLARAIRAGARAGPGGGPDAGARRARGESRGAQRLARHRRARGLAAHRRDGSRPAVLRGGRAHGSRLAPAADRPAAGRGTVAGDGAHRPARCGPAPAPQARGARVEPRRSRHRRGACHGVAGIGRQGADTLAAHARGHARGRRRRFRHAHRRRRVTAQTGGIDTWIEAPGHHAARGRAPPRTCGRGAGPRSSSGREALSRAFCALGDFELQVKVPAAAGILGKAAAEDFPLDGPAEPEPVPPPEEDHRIACN